MRKNWFCILTVAVVFLLAYNVHAFTLYSEPVTNFDDWSKTVNWGEVQFVPNGSSLIVMYGGHDDKAVLHTLQQCHSHQMGLFSSPPQARMTLPVKSPSKH